MAYQHTFKRYELKYILSQDQLKRVEAQMLPFMKPDQYGRTFIRNLYFDTEDYRLIRRSLEKPVYKEKLRLRSYRKAEADDPVFVELKKKYDGIVYKRRLSLPQQQATAWLDGRSSFIRPCQIADEINYFCSYYGNLQPKVFLCYQRQAWYSLDGSDFRVTFDNQILCRQTDLSLNSDIWGTPILPEEKVLMEIKTSGGIPLWMTRFLTGERIFKTSYSKYGTAYQQLIYPKIKGEFIYDRSNF